MKQLLAVFLFLALLPLTLRGAEADSADPAKELASFQMAPGFEANLFASEKDGVLKPIQIRFDSRGRIWVIGSVVYPQLEPGQVPDDKVLILEDTNGDGKSDKTTIFADGLMIPTGIELGNGGVYVGHGTELLFLKDTNGDDRADSREVVLRGFGTGDNHQNINSFMFGPGGEMWMCQGLHTHSNVETPWGIVRMEKAGLWRFRPLLKKLEGFYGSEHEPQNPWGYVFTKWGEPIVIAGNNSSMIYPVPGLTSSHKDLPPHLIWKNGQGRKSSGADIVETAHFPDDWQGLLITGGYINNAVWALRISEDGSGFALEDLPPLIRSTDRSFRPVDVKFGPDGSLYICDWYNPIIGHYQASFRHPERDKNHGRIWRVTAKGRPLSRPPSLHGASLPELLKLLDSCDGWSRKFAKRVLSERPKAEVAIALKEWCAKRDLTELALKEALGVLQSHEIVDRSLLERVATSKEPGARAYAATVVGLWADRLNEPIELLKILVRDEHPRVRLQSVVAATYLKRADAINVALTALENPTDKFLDYALTQAVFALKPFWLPALKTGELSFENSAHLTFLINADGTPDTLAILRELVASATIKQETKHGLILTLVQTGNADDLTRVFKASALFDAPVLRAVREALRLRNIKPNGDLATLLRPLLSSDQPALRSEALRLAGAWKVHSLRQEVMQETARADTPAIFHEAAMDALASYADENAVRHLVQLAEQGDGDSRSAAVIALSRVDLAAAGEAAASLAAVNTSAWEGIFAAFLQRQGGPAALLKAFQSKPPPKTVAETGVRVMNVTGRKDVQLDAFLAGIGGEQPQDHKSRLTDAFYHEVQTRGDSVRGREIYRRVELGCVNCHLVYGEGGKIGPDLSALGTAQPLDFIAGAILEPQKEVKEGFNSVLVVTKDEEEYQGYIVRENPAEVVVRDVLKGEEITIARSQVASRRQSGSVMPAGLADTLSAEEFRDLLKYLSELGRPGAHK